MRIRVLGLLTASVMLSTAFVMWYPNRYVFGIDLGNNMLQGSLFALSMFLWALLRGGTLRSDPYFEFRSGIWELSAATVGRNIVRISIELLLLAAVLEIGQAFLSHRHFAIGEFFFNALGISVVAGAFYILVALGLRTPFGKRLALFFTRLD
jgi:hypothetical protein